MKATVIVAFVFYDATLTFALVIFFKKFDTGT